MINWRGLFWPFLFYAFLFMLTGSNGSQASLIDAAVVAGLGAIILSFCMLVFLQLPDMGIPWRKAMNGRNWPPYIRKGFARMLFIIALWSALCILGALWFK